MNYGYKKMGKVKEKLKEKQIYQKGKTNSWLLNIAAYYMTQHHLSNVECRLKFSVRWNTIEK